MFHDICVNNANIIIHKKIFLSIANLKCASLDRPIYPKWHMHPRLGKPGIVGR